jgi:hypothetical protein
MSDTFVAIRNKKHTEIFAFKNKKDALDFQKIAIKNGYETLIGKKIKGGVE